MSGAPRLVCPRCRRAEGGRLVVHELEAAPGGLGCPGCGELYPVVDGVPLVLRDLDAWLESEAPAVLCRDDLPAPALERLVRGARGALRRDADLLASWSAPLQGTLPGRVRELTAPLEVPLLDLGCGTGALHGRRDATGLDLSFGLARAFCGRGVVGDAHDPPFRAGAFAGVLLLNLLDASREPLLVLQQADALLRRGGTLLVTTPWCWSDAVTAPAQRLDAAALRPLLQGQRGLPLDYELLEEQDGLTWRVPTGPRLVHEYRCQLWVARKRGGPA
jgi:SAM-dependent methyltransferase/uncharacterized protein YbaR (Trm112 family)